MRSTLQQIEDITHKWKAAQLRYKAYRRAVFVLWTMRDIPDLCLTLELQMNHVHMIRDQASQAGGKLAAGAVDAIMVKLHQEGFIKQKLNSNPKRDKTTVTALKQSGYDPTDPLPLKLNKEQKLMMALKQQGLSMKDAQKVVDLYKRELDRKPEINNAISPGPSTGAESGADENSTKGCKILIVGTSNGLWSTVAHAYLELVRAWTVNNGGPWLFHRVDSAGIDIDTAFRRGPGKLAEDTKLIPGGKPCSMLALNGLFEDGSYFRTDDHPREKQSIFERAGNTQTSWHTRRRLPAI